MVKRWCLLLVMGMSLMCYAQYTDMTLISANLQAGIEQSVETVLTMSQDTTYYDDNQTLNYVYEVQVNANAAALSFEFAIDGIVDVASGVQEDSADYYALTQLYELAYTGYEAFNYVSLWMTEISSALLNQDEDYLNTLIEYSSDVDGLLSNYAWHLDAFLQAYDDTTPSDPYAGVSAIEYLEEQPAEVYSSPDTYGLMSDVSSWGHSLNMSIINNFPTGGSSYSCRRGVDPGCY